MLAFGSMNVKAAAFFLNQLALIAVFFVPLVLFLVLLYRQVVAVANKPYITFYLFDVFLE